MQQIFLHIPGGICIPAFRIGFPNSTPSWIAIRRQQPALRQQKNKRTWWEPSVTWVIVGRMGGWPCEQGVDVCFVYVHPDFGSFSRPAKALHSQTHLRTSVWAKQIVGLSPQEDNNQNHLQKPNVLLNFWAVNGMHSFKTCSLTFQNLSLTFQKGTVCLKLNSENWGVILLGGRTSEIPWIFFVSN